MSHIQGLHQVERESGKSTSLPNLSNACNFNLGHASVLVTCTWASMFVEIAQIALNGIVWHQSGHHEHSKPNQIMKSTRKRHVHNHGEVTM
jgi:hypothetical protein